MCTSNIDRGAVLSRPTAPLNQVRLPLTGRRLRLLLYGGGGCGKTRIINSVLAKLFRRFYGPKGLVLNAFANKPARLINGTTTHGLIKCRGGQSLSIAHLRIQNDKQRRALAAVWRGSLGEERIRTAAWCFRARACCSSNVWKGAISRSAL